MKNKISVLYIHQDGIISGSAISLRNMLSAINPEKINVRVLLAKDGPLREIYERIGIPVDFVPIDRYFAIPGAPWFMRSYHENWLALRPNPELEDYLRELNPDIVHINDQPMIQAGLSCFRVGLPVVWHIRGTYAISRSRIQAAISKKIIQHIAKSLIAISEDEAAPFRNDPRIRVINNSIDNVAVIKARQQRSQIRNEFGIDQDEIVIGMVGYLSTSKGAWDFIESAGIVKKNLPGFKLRFLIVAPIPSREPRKLGWREQLRLVDTSHPEDKAWKLARQFGIEENLILTGFRPDAMDVMRGMDVLVSCFRLGAIGRPAFESMAVGTPVVVTAGASGCSQVVRHLETGLVVPPGDIKAIADAIIKLVKNTELRNKLVKNGFIHTQLYFDPQKNARRVEQIYEEVIKSSSNLHENIGKF